MSVKIIVFFPEYQLIVIFVCFKESKKAIKGIETAVIKSSFDYKKEIIDKKFFAIDIFESDARL